MNDAIDSRLEALAFQYVSFGLFTVVNNLWTLVAVVTAAVSVLGIRAAAGSSAVRLRRRQPGPAAPRVDVGDAVGGPIPEEERRPADAAAAADDRSSAASTSGGDYCLRSEMGDGVTKGRRKFTTYYKDDGECEYVCDSSAAEAEAEEEEGDAGEGGSCGGGEWWESWERVLKARSGETWWYRCQDAGALDGAVVRLWDDSLCGGGAGRRRRGSSGGAAVWW